MPRVQEELLKFFEATETGSKKRELGHSLNTDEAAAMGAVFKAADLSAGFKVRGESKRYHVSTVVFL